MTDKNKVLGFKEWNAVIVPKIKDMGLSIPRSNGKSEMKEPVCIYLEEKDLVPVRLKSESVSLDWLEKMCKINQTSHIPFGVDKIISVKDLLSAAKKEALK